MHKGFIEYCPECHYHTDFHELSLLGALRQVKADWEDGKSSTALWAIIEKKYPYSQACMTTCPICGADLKSWWGDGDPVTEGPYLKRTVSKEFMEDIINGTV